jgi:hypothetical protein
MKKVIFTLLVVSIYILSYAQEVKWSPKEVNTIKMLRATLFLKNDQYPVYLDNQAFNYERTDEGYLRMSAKKNPGLADAIIGDSYTSYLIIVHDDFPRIEFFRECKENGIITIPKWKGDFPQQSGSSMFSDGDWVYDFNGHIKEVNLGKTYKRMANSRKIEPRITKIKFGYDEEGRLNKATRIVEVFKRTTSHSNMKYDYTIEEYSFAYTYGADQTTLEIDQYRKGKRGSEKSKEINYTLMSNGWQTVTEKETIQYKDGVPGDKRLNVIKKDYDPYWRLSRRYEENEQSINTNDYIYDQKGRILEEVEKTINRDNNKITRHITYANKYNTKDLLFEQTILIKKEGKVTQKKVINYTYTPKEKGNPVTKCEHKKEYITRHYDENDVLYREEKGGKVRLKENGVWGPWQFLRS